MFDIQKSKPLGDDDSNVAAINGVVPRIKDHVLSLHDSLTIGREKDGIGLNGICFIRRQVQMLIIII